MKSLFVLGIALLSASAGYAQQEKASAGKPATITPCSGPARLKGPKPLYVIVHQGKEYEFSPKDSTLKTLNPNDIKSINVLRSPASETKYKEKAKGGAILLTLKEDNNFAAFRKLESSVSLLNTGTDDTMKQ